MLDRHFAPSTSVGLKIDLADWLDINSSTYKTALHRKELQKYC